MKINFLYFFAYSLFSSALIAGDWPGWRGENRDDISNEKGLLKSWPSSGPDKIWMNEDGGLGYAGFSVSNGGLYTMGAFGNTEKLLAFNASTGKKVWELPIGDLLTNGWGDGPRTTPSVSDGKVYALGGKGNLVCADSRTGQKIWETHLVKDLGGKVPGWGYTESVLVDEGESDLHPRRKWWSLVCLGCQYR